MNRLNLKIGSENNLSMGIFYFPCDFVYWKKIDSHETYKSRLLQKLHENDNLLSNTHSSYLTNASTTVESLGHWITNSDRDIIEDIVWKSLDELLAELNARPNCSQLKINNSFITNSWFMKYEEKGSVAVHNHHEVFPPMTMDGKPYKMTFSMFYILKNDNPGNQTEFIQPTMSGTSVSESYDTRFKTSEVEEIEEGTVVIFPSNLYHQVCPIEKPNRVILSFNICSTFQ